MSPIVVVAMQIVPPSRFRQAALAALLLVAGSMPAAAFDLFARHQVSVQFATAEGKPLADAEVRVFAPGRPDRPALTGHTDSAGKFEFPADEDGLWKAEARATGEIAHVSIRVGGAAQQRPEPLSPYWVIGALFLLLILAFGFRLARARVRRRSPRP